MIDAHIHLDQYQPGERSVMLRQLHGCGIEAVIAVSMNMESCVQTAKLASRMPDRVKPAYGYHPEQPLPSPEELASLISWIRQHADEMIAVGEIGLPYYTRAELKQSGQSLDEAAYVNLLEQFLELAHELDKPVVLHAVYEDALTACDLLEQHGISRAHFHWFKGPDEAVELMAKRGYYISFTPDLLYEPEIQALARRYPAELVMAETDGPWPFEGPFQGQTTHPRMILESSAFWGKLHGWTAEEARKRLTANTRRFYGI